mmetsp:Transcript_5345/g.11027  ORF Transcript_5345/g.11027 Transcript_5345/m.11027 type:complete len:269 (+) Transcript_5345:1223-2029(+)
MLLTLTKPSSQTMQSLVHAPSLHRQLAVGYILTKSTTTLQMNLTTLFQRSKSACLMTNASQILGLHVPTRSSRSYANLTVMTLTRNPWIAPRSRPWTLSESASALSISPRLYPPLYLHPSHLPETIHRVPRFLRLRVTPREVFITQIATMSTASSRLRLRQGTLPSLQELVPLQRERPTCLRITCLQQQFTKLKAKVLMVPTRPDLMASPKIPKSLTAKTLAILNSSSNIVNMKMILLPRTTRVHWQTKGDKILASHSRPMLPAYPPT